MTILNKLINEIIIRRINGLLKLLTSHRRLDASGQRKPLKKLLHLW